MGYGNRLKRPERFWLTRNNITGINPFIIKWVNIGTSISNLDFHLILSSCVKSDEKIALLGAIQSLFEGSMYTFVFLWTPALSPNNEDIPHGFIFSIFMLSSMLGSSLASRLLARASIKVESYMQVVFVISSAALLLPVITSVRDMFFLRSFCIKINAYI